MIDWVGRIMKTARVNIDIDSCPYRLLTLLLHVYVYMDTIGATDGPRPQLYVCIYKRIKYLHVYIHVHIYYMYIYIHVCNSLSVYVYVYVCQYAKRFKRMFICIYKHMYVCIHVPIYRVVYIYIYR